MRLGERCQLVRTEQKKAHKRIPPILLSLAKKDNNEIVRVRRRRSLAKSEKKKRKRMRQKSFTGSFGTHTAKKEKERK